MYHAQTVIFMQWSFSMEFFTRWFKDFILSPYFQGDYKVYALNGKSAGVS